MIDKLEDMFSEPSPTMLTADVLLDEFVIEILVFFLSTMIENIFIILFEVELVTVSSSSITPSPILSEINNLLSFDTLI